MHKGGAESSLPKLPWSPYLHEGITRVPPPIVLSMAWKNLHEQFRARYAKSLIHNGLRVWHNLCWNSGNRNTRTEQHIGLTAQWSSSAAEGHSCRTSKRSRR